MLLRLAALSMKNGNTDNAVTNWVTPPNPPVRIVTHEKALNLYLEDSTRVVNGQRYLIEVTNEEMQSCGGELYWLLGGSGRNLDFNWFNNDGADITPHLTHRTLRSVSYEFLYLDQTGGGDPVLAPIVPICGMALKPAKYPCDFQPPSEVYIQMALGILARSWPIIADISSAYVEVCCSMFAEPYGGVHVRDVSGNNEANSGYDCHLRSGDVEIPSGNTSCSLFSKITKNSSLVANAKTKVSELHTLSCQMSTIRRVAEMEAFSVQMSMRAMGLSIAIVFPRVPWANIFLTPIPRVLHDMTRRGDSHFAICREKDSNEPCQFGIYNDKMMLTLFEALPPETLSI